MKGKFHLAKVKPTIDILGNVAYDAGDVLFDWYKFEIPRGAANLMGMQILYRGKNGADVTPTDFEIIWAKGNPDGTAPTSLGVTTAAVGVPTAGSPPWFNLLIGKSYIDASKSTNDGDLTYMNVMTPQSVAGGEGIQAYLYTSGTGGFIMEGEPNSGSNVGYDKLYCALIAKATHNWGASTITVNGTPAATQKVMTVADVGANIMFAPGDVIYDEDDRLMGTVKSIDSATQITFEDNLANAGVNDKVLYNASPITLVLSFEK